MRRKRRMSLVLAIIMILTIFTPIGSEAKEELVVTHPSKSRYRIIREGVVNHYVDFYTINNQASFCVEPAVAAKTGLVPVSSDEYINKRILGIPKLNSRLGLIAYFGYTLKEKTDDNRAFTQVLIWEEIISQNTKYYGAYYNSENENVRGISFEKEDVQNLYLKWKENILESVRSVLEDVPSFNGNKLNIMANEEKTINDENNILSKMKFRDTNNKSYKNDDFSLEIDGNTLRVKGNKDLKELKEIRVNLVQDSINSSDIGGENIFYTTEDGKGQRIGKLNFVDPGSGYIILELEKPDFNIKKIDQFERPVKGVEFLISDKLEDLDNSNGIKLVTDENGKLSSNLKLHLGKYYIKEILTPDGYEVNDEVYEIEITRESLKDGLFIFTIYNNKLPSIKTKASVFGKKEVDPINNLTIIDKISYENLEVGKEYEISGYLMDRETKEAILIDGKKVTSSKSFTPENRDGFVEVEFNLDGSLLKGKEVVVFESLLKDSKLLLSHFEIEDDDQTVKIRKPSILSSLTDKEDKEKNLQINSDEVLVDKVTYEDLIIGNEYTLEGLIVDKDTKEEISTSSVKFTPTSENGEIELDFDLNTEGLEKKSIVAIQYLYWEGNLVCEHDDLENEDQTIHFPKIETTASGNEGEKIFNPIKEVKIVDLVNYENLNINKEYTLKGLLVDKETNKEITNASITFTPKETSGSIKLEFIVDGNDLRGKEVVAFESLYYMDKLIAIHHDLEDKDQTVEFVNPSIKTKAFVNGKKVISGDGKYVLKDKISYSNLVENEEYELVGILMDKNTSSPLIVNGKEVTSKSLFTPDNKDGEYEMDFNIKASDLKGKDIVVFEKLYYKGELICSHEDIDDLNQTITFLDNPSPQTGDRGIVNYILVMILAMVILFINIKRRIRV